MTGLKASPLVSVVMAAHNAARTLREAIDSVLSQTFADLELIVCDDTSSDDTPAILASYRDPRLVRLANPRNLGPGRSRDEGIAHARGRWIAFIDADDAWRPGRLQALLQATAGREDVLVFDNLMQCHDSPRGMVPWRAMRRAGAFGSAGGRPCQVALADFISSHRLLIKPLIPVQAIRDQALRHSDLRFAEDTEFFLGAIGAGLRLVYVDQPLYLYRITPGSLSANPARADQMLTVLSRLRDEMPLTPADRAGFDRKIAMVRADAAYQPFLQALKSGCPLEAVRLLVQRPALLAAFLYRLRESLPYQLHLRRHGARGR